MVNQPEIDQLVRSMEMAVQAHASQVDKMEQMRAEAAEKVDQMLAAQAKAERKLDVFREVLRERQELLMDTKAAAAGENPVEDMAALLPRMVALKEKLDALEREE